MFRSLAIVSSLAMFACGSAPKPTAPVVTQPVKTDTAPPSPALGVYFLEATGDASNGVTCGSAIEQGVLLRKDAAGALVVAEAADPAVVYDSTILGMQVEWAEPDGSGALTEWCDAQGQVTGMGVHTVWHIDASALTGDVVKTITHACGSRVDICAYSVQAAHY